MAGRKARYCEECGSDPCSCDTEYWDSEDIYGLNARMRFADPGGNSALRASGPGNPRNLPCPTCGGENLLTPADRAAGYQCDGCADRAEGGGY